MQKAQILGAAAASALLFSLLGAALPPVGDDVPKGHTVQSEKSQRGNTRLYFWGQGHSIGELSIDYGQPAWKDSHQKTVEEAQAGMRWRLGQNFWTSLDTNIPITLGEQELEPGQNYLALAVNEEGDFDLLVLDAYSAPLQMHAEA